MDMNDYIGPFIDETEENLQSLNELLLAFEEGKREVIGDIFRVAHTLKGMAATMGFSNMTKLTHAMEDVFDEVRNDRIHLRRSEDVSMLFDCLDTLNLILEDIRENGNDGNVDISAVTDNLIKVLHSEGLEEKTDEGISLENIEDQAFSDSRKVTVKLKKDCMLKGARAFMVLEEIASAGQVLSSVPVTEKLIEGEFEGDQFVLFLDSEVPSEKISQMIKKVNEIEDCSVEEILSSEIGTELQGFGEKEKQKSPHSQSPDSQKKGKKEKDSDQEKTDREHRSQQNKNHQTVRVDVQKLDKLLNLVGELVIGRSRIERLARESQFKEFEEPILQLGRISKEIQELVTKLRMLPISFIFDRFPRLVRDLSQSLGKKVSLKLEGRETELDRSVIDEIADPMVHLIRNSLDHGLEIPEERVAAGKNETGLLRVRAYQDGSSVVVAVEDDGKGIDVEKTVVKAVEKGLISAEEGENITEHEAYQLLFAPGLSTSDEITDISGRGVGMDAVKGKVESLGGRISIESEKGRGTTIKVKLPITLAIVLALLVKIDGNTYAIPLESVDETIRVEKDQVDVVNGGLVTMLRGSILNLIDARKFYGLPERQGVEDHSVVVMRTGFRRIGFIVDDFVGQQEIVIKNLVNRGRTKIEWFSGGTILGDGSVALIVDPAAVD